MGYSFPILSSRSCFLSPVVTEDYHNVELFQLWHGSPSRFPPGCIILPAATFLNCIYVYNRSYTICKAVRCTIYCSFSSCGPQTSPQKPVWHCALKTLETHELWLIGCRKLDVVITVLEVTSFIVSEVLT